MANLLPHVDLYFPGTSKLMAKLFFRSTTEAVQFTEDKLSPLSLCPLCCIYLDVLYWPKGKPFLFNNELLHFAPAEVKCLEWIDYRQLYREILSLTNIVKEEPEETIKSIQTDHIDALAYSIYGLKFDFSKPDLETEKKIIDQLDLPALENSLNEAVRIENYEAAAYIKKRIEDKDYSILEGNNGVLIVKNKSN